MSNWGTNPKLPNLLGETGRMRTYCQAVAEAMELALGSDPRVRLFGEGVTDKAGTYGTTKGLEERFGPGRVFDVPTAEGVITGLGVGMALGGLRPIVVHPRNDFMLLAIDQLCNHAAKWSAMFGGKTNCPVTVRSVACRGWGSAAQHSQALHAMLAQFPGLMVAAPFTPADAKGMLLWAALHSPGPVAVMEHKWLWNLCGPVEEGVTACPPDGPRILRRGKDLTIVGVSYGVAEAMMAAAELSGGPGIEAEVIDLRWLRPLCMGPIVESLSRTGRLMVIDTGHVGYGVSGEIVARAAGELPPGAWKASPVRIGMPDAPVPGASEDRYFPTRDAIVQAAGKLAKQ